MIKLIIRKSNAKIFLCKINIGAIICQKKPYIIVSQKSSIVNDGELKGLKKSSYPVKNPSSFQTDNFRPQKITGKIMKRKLLLIHGHNKDINAPSLFS